MEYTLDIGFLTFWWSEVRSLQRDMGWCIWRRSEEHGLDMIENELHLTTSERHLEYLQSTSTTRQALLKAKYDIASTFSNNIRIHSAYTFRGGKTTKI